MLIQFNFKNFNSFRDEVSLDLSATNITEFPDHVININNASQDKILPIAAIYGANASGKSTVYKAFDYMTDFVINSFMYGGDNSKNNSKESKFLKPTPFLLDKHSKSVDSSFEVYFEKNEKVYNYGFCVNQEKVTEEWLNVKSKNAKNKTKNIFTKDEKGIDWGTIPKTIASTLESSLEKETLIVSLGAKLKILEFKSVRKWFWDNNLVDFGNPLLNYLMSNRLPNGFVDSQETRESVVRYMSSFDNSIAGFEVGDAENDIKKDSEELVFKVDALHKMIGSDEKVAIPLGSESEGTLKMFSLYSGVTTALKQGSVLFIDELNGKLHPLLIRDFISTFLNPKLNPNHAQLIFTTHDTWQLSSDLFRRDEIWFAKKDDNGISSLYSLVDFSDENGSKIRKDENYEKNYMLGKYGAVPTLKPIITLGTGAVDE